METLMEMREVLFDIYSFLLWERTMRKKTKAEMRAWLEHPDREKLTRRLEQRIAELKREAQDRARRASS